MRIVTKTHVLLLIATFGVGAAGAIFWMREPMEPLTREGLTAARQRWRAAAVGGYEMRYQMLRSDYFVRSRGGIIEDVTVNGQVPTSGNWQAYGVEGLFETLELELANADDPAGPFASGKSLVMRVRYNPDLGYVERYLRSSGGHGKGAVIEVGVFVRLDRIEG